MGFIYSNGTVEVTNNGDGTYNLVLDVWGERYNCQGTYSGAIASSDQTSQSVAAKAPAKRSAMEMVNLNNGSKRGASIKKLEFTPKSNNTIRKHINF